MNLKYAVIGTGALGGFYGGMLANSGKDVHFLFNTDYEHVKKNGLKVDSILGNFHLSTIAAYKQANDMPVCDVILVCLKTMHNQLLDSILPLISHSDSLVILIQNGLGVENDVAAKFPTLNIAGGMAFICSNKIGKGHINHLDYGSLNLGAFYPDKTELLQQVYADFNQANVKATLAPDLMLARWQKLVWNIPFNGMSVVLNTTTDRLINNINTKTLAHEMMLEVIEAAQHCGVAIQTNYAQKIIEMTEKMKPYATSMKLDYDNKRPLEIDYIYTSTIQTAQKAGYEMKKVAVLEKQLRFIQQSYLQQ